MSKLVAIVVSLVFIVTAAMALAESESKASIKAGSSIYACSCGAGCGCGTMSNNAGKCGCGKPMVKTMVSKVENGKAYYRVNGKEVSAPVAGAYVCSCGEGCPCNAVSQKPGTCGCGKPLKKAE